MTTPISKDRYATICKMGQGAACCKFLAASPDGIICAKTQEWLAISIAMRDDMVAKGDNCPGWPEDEVAF